MIQGLRGSLLSHEALAAAGYTTVADDAIERARRTARGWYGGISREGGPAWNARLVFDRVAVPLCRAFGLELLVRTSDERHCRGTVHRDGSVAASFITLGWDREPGGGWREGLSAALESGVRWCYCFNGSTVRFVDITRTHSRRFVDVDVSSIARSPDTFAVLWNLLAVRSPQLGLDAAVAISERHRVDVRGALQHGVLDALTALSSAFKRATRRSSQRDPAVLLDESLVVIYRILFLLFAEARGLVPTWHPIYRDGYTLEALRAAVESGRRVPGTWAALQAMARLAHAGCRAGTLRVPPFNGPLFSPERAQLAASTSLDDEDVRKALVALTSRPTASGRRRISFADLGVEHLGGVYERVLDFDLQAEAGRVTLTQGHRRKTTGSFYTPRSLTEFLVRRTLAPLVEEATPERILSLRILDPSMGSGAFLVAACRYLASAYEDALLREGGLSPSDLSEADRAGFRRLVAQRTLFGVDLNPMAVQLARLSLWLATLCADRPLTFFDHHLRAGNSLAGATLSDIVHVRSGRRGRAQAAPLLADDSLDGSLGRSVAARMTLTLGREDTLDEVRSKEALLARLSDRESVLGRLKAVCDLWCEGWFDSGSRAVDRATLGALCDYASGARSGLSGSVATPLLERGRAAGGRERFFHWELEFPEVFRDDSGRPLASPGFDAVIGNPPWEVLRADAGPAGARLTRFARSSGVFRHQGSGHTNLYQLFTERALALVRPGGRLGLILPSGIATDHGSMPLRRLLMDGAAIDSFTVADNREALFPIHRGLRFVLATLTRDPGKMRAIPLRFGITSALEFDRLPSTRPDPEAVAVPKGLLERFSGEQLVIPAFRSAMDVEVLTRVLAHTRPAADPAGWNLRFGRELNATEDKVHFTDRPGGLPVIEGKHLQPFAVDVNASERFLPRSAAQSVASAIPYDRLRIAYRDVASATNRLTLIAAVLPAGTITTHTLFCVRTDAEEDDLHFLAGMFNSFVANYVVRLRVTTHVTAGVMERLPLPGPERASRESRLMVTLARRLSSHPADHEAMAALQGTAARLYGLEGDEFRHVLATFPLIDARLRSASLDAYSRTL